MRFNGPTSCLNYTTDEIANDRVAWNNILGVHMLVASCTPTRVQRQPYPRVATWRKKKGRFLAEMVIPFFEGNIPAARLTPDDNEARSRWMVRLHSYGMKYGLLHQFSKHQCTSLHSSSDCKDRSARADRPVTIGGPRSHPGFLIIRLVIAAIFIMVRPNFQTTIETQHDVEGIVDQIRTFLNYLRPVLMIDAAHLKGIYKGTNLVAVAMDGNNQIVPIAFGIMQKGRKQGHAAIALAVEKEFPLAFHAVCCRHLMMNLGLKNKKRKGLFWKICKAYTREDYATNMNTLQIVQMDAHGKAW
ncbi:hypothetical protein Tco_0371105 [Tanacetum coccineum]